MHRTRPGQLVRKTAVLDEEWCPCCAVWAGVRQSVTALLVLHVPSQQAVACGETIKVIQKVVDKNTYTFVDVQVRHAPSSYTPSFSASHTLWTPSDVSPLLTLLAIPSLPRDQQEDTVVLDRHQISKVSWTDDGQVRTSQSGGERASSSSHSLERV